MMMKVMLMKIVVCVSDEVLNSQHYKHSQSTEASDQYANTRKIIYLKTVEMHSFAIFFFGIVTNTFFIFHFQKQTFIMYFMSFWVKLLPLNTI